MCVGTENDEMNELLTKIKSTHIKAKSDVYYISLSKRVPISQAQQVYCKHLSTNWRSKIREKPRKH